MNKLSGPSNAPNFGARMEEAFYMVLGSEDPSEDRIGRRGGKVAYKDVLATVQKFLHKDGPVYKELEKKCFAEQNERKAKYEQEQEELRQERNRRAAEEAQQFQNVQGAIDDNAVFTYVNQPGVFTYTITETFYGAEDAYLIGVGTGASNEPGAPNFQRQSGSLSGPKIIGNDNFLPALKKAYEEHKIADTPDWVKRGQAIPSCLSEQW
eukprot:scaffold17876_cov77-Skeletonema_dohrnii-CCMP3373.AAC.1